ncbi:hypothetical protein JZ751_007067 [Albula glossodonta]|uniref:Receptor expression-enhancing protein n=1 Tax=Albula glossodonta TaxID=121402 RepID=A0A8T2P4L0_9TELE|nr:hypothetical protein JZ751_007067 [Albula glossodonta]
MKSLLLGVFPLRFPFYFELKIAFVIWLLSPYTKGSSVLYRKFVHPTLSNKEKEIDEYIAQARDRSYDTMMRFGKRGLNLAANAAVTAATKVRRTLQCHHWGQGVLSEKLRSFSMQDLTLIRDEDELRLHTSDPRLRGSTGMDGAEDVLIGGTLPRAKSASRQARMMPTTTASDDLHHSAKPDVDHSDARTEQSDEDAVEKVPKRTASVKAKKPTAAKTEVQRSMLPHYSNQDCKETAKEEDGSCSWQSNRDCLSRASSSPAQLDWRQERERERDGGSKEGRELHS